MLNLVAILACLIGYSYFFSLCFRWSFATTPLFTISCLTVINYLAALAGELSIIAESSLFLGYLLFFISLIYDFLYKKSSKIIREPAFTSFILLVILMWLRIHSGGFNAWDEFSHWGPRIKTLFMTNALFNSNQHLVHVDYPPGTAIFQYLILQINHYFSESSIYLAQNLFVICALLSFLQNLIWKNWKLIIGILLAGLLIIGAKGLSSIYVDEIVGLYFGCIISNYLLASDKKACLYRLIPSAMCLSLLKESAIALILVIFICLSFLIIVEYYKEKNSWNFNKTGKVFPELFLLFLLIACSFITAYSWHYYVVTHHLQIGNLSPYNLSLDKIEALIHHTGTLEKTILDNFSCKVNGIALKFILIFGVILFLQLPTQKINHEKLKIFGTYFLLALGFITYLLGLLYSYLFNFSSGEAIRLASMNRYVSTYFIAICLVSLAFFILQAKKDFEKIKSYLGIIFILVVALLSSPGKNIAFWVKGVKENSIRNDIHEKNIAVTKITSPESKIYITWKESEGEGYVITRYELLPRSYNSSCWSINFSETDECNFNNFKQYLRGYDYLYLANPDPIFLQKLVKEFPQTNSKKMLYKIDVKANKELTLRPVN